MQTSCSCRVLVIAAMCAMVVAVVMAVVVAIAWWLQHVVTMSYGHFSRRTCCVSQIQLHHRYRGMGSSIHSLSRCNQSV